MGVRSDPTRTLYKMMGIPGIASLQNQFNPTEHLPGAPGVNYFAPGHLDFYSKVPLYSGNRIYCDSLCHMTPPFSEKGLLFNPYAND